MSLLNELEDIHTYLAKEDAFFFTMVYDPTQKTLLVDKGEIRVGTDYQAEISPYVDPGMWCMLVSTPQPLLLCTPAPVYLTFHSPKSPQPLTQKAKHHSTPETPPLFILVQHV